MHYVFTCINILCVDVYFTINKYNQKDLKVMVLRVLILMIVINKKCT